MSHAWIVWDEIPGDGPGLKHLPTIGAAGTTLPCGIPAQKGEALAVAILGAFPNVRRATADDFEAAGLELPPEFAPPPALKIASPAAAKRGK